MSSKINYLFIPRQKKVLKQVFFLIANLSLREGVKKTPKVTDRSVNGGGVNPQSVTKIGAYFQKREKFSTVLLLTFTLERVGDYETACTLLYIRPLSYFTPTGYKDAPRPCQSQSGADTELTLGGANFRRKFLAPPGVFLALKFFAGLFQDHLAPSGPR